MSEFELVHIQDDNDRTPLKAKDYNSALEEGLKFLEYKVERRREHEIKSELQ